MFGCKPVDLRVAAVAQDQPILAVKVANALGDSVDDRLVLLHLRLQLGDRGVAIIHDDVMALGSHYCERTQAIGRGYLHNPLDWNCTQWRSLRFDDRGRRNRP